MNHHPELEPIIRFFQYSHLPTHLARISQPFHELACEIIENEDLNDTAERYEGLRKLLEAKDCIVRSALKT